MESFISQINILQIEARFDLLSRKIYSVDASIFEIEPLGILYPKTQQEILAILQIAAENNIPVIPRGAATGITGGCLGHGLIIDLSKYLNRILEINIEEEYALCEPGVVQDQLNEALSPFGYRLGPDTSTGNRATLGGMLANNAAGARSLYFGRMIDSVLSVELALAGGHLITCEALSLEQYTEKLQQPGLEGHIYREIDRIRERYGSEIAKRFPNIPRHVSGYNLDQLVKEFPYNLSRLISGSEGTLGIATQIKVRIVKKLNHTQLCVIHVHDMIEALESIEEMLAFQPVSLEMIDHHILEIGRSSPAVKNKLEWLQGKPQAVFVAEFTGETEENVEEITTRFKNHMEALRIGYAHIILRDAQQKNHVWEVRKAGLGLLLSKRTYTRAIAFIEDLSVAPHNLAAFLQMLTTYLKGIGKEVGIYGHIGSGCMHIRPFMDLKSTDEISQIKKIMLDVADMVLSFSGGLSGEHGDGLIRSWLNKKMFGEELYQAFIELKASFDPGNLMNPGKIVHASEIEAKNLRINPKIKQTKLPTFLDFSAEGGLELAADMCNGNGQCRKAEGTMCPSFQATNDEYHTTRARAQSLRAIINGRLPKDEFTSKALYEVLDLCIECKGCKTECPSQVDMAKMKSEFLYQYQQKHGYSLRNRLFTHIATINRFALPFAKIFNYISSTRFNKNLLNRWLGISPQRDLPKLATVTFSNWFKQQPQSPSLKKVVLFNDTFTEYNHPEIGQAAFKILSNLGYEITLISDLCCGRPLISKGFLEEARNKALKFVNTLKPYAFSGLKIICLEPSCLSALNDDYKGLLGTGNSALFADLILVSDAAISFDNFLSNHLHDSQLPLKFKENSTEVLVHGHCHQKALADMQPTLNVLKAIPGFSVTEINSGCCGMAGAFGYESEHYDISMKIGNLRLFPAIKKASAETLIVANGMSCRCQIHHGTDRRALHLAEAVAQQLKNS